MASTAARTAAKTGETTGETGETTAETVAEQTRPLLALAPGYQPRPVGRRSLFQVEVANREL